MWTTKYYVFSFFFSLSFSPATHENAVTLVVNVGPCDALKREWEEEIGKVHA